MKPTRLTQKGQATIPLDIRKKLDLHPGNKIGFEITDGNVTIRKIQAFDYEYHYALARALSEWSSKEDNEAYKQDKLAVIKKTQIHLKPLFNEK